MWNVNILACGNLLAHINVVKEGGREGDKQTNKQNWYVQLSGLRNEVASFTHTNSPLGQNPITKLITLFIIFILPHTQHPKKERKKRKSILLNFVVVLCVLELVWIVNKLVSHNLIPHTMVVVSGFGRLLISAS